MDNLTISSLIPTVEDTSGNPGGSGGPTETSATNAVAPQEVTKKIEMQPTQEIERPSTPQTIVEEEKPISLADLAKPVAKNPLSIVDMRTKGPTHHVAENAAADTIYADTEEDLFIVNQIEEHKPGSPKPQSSRPAHEHK